MSAPYPFEIIPDGSGFTWRILAGCGRALVYSDRIYPTKREAVHAAKDARMCHAERASAVDAA